MLMLMIEEKRKQMIELGKKHGLSSAKTITCSQELDRLIEKYQITNQQQYTMEKEVSFN
ncbi:aspartyl-phosphate phosphatase Spo0E family protein [Pseudalkalibacillus caeni]|uniref:Aspartyl-phosphate phosphatase Spo0E family protein n=1 Tax=Exobacillus caeni TaxID=2574798 RepID=A0A5R9F251_9BACL|nr:aspartyl-phosphate phosphatase Spo0E family protein [Pseudalkalibacillus caeni]TLS37722.1 aspartyl-phosphate phosphatase Spo0E family protein [Pseudalkalibacillus caeni]